MVKFGIILQRNAMVASFVAAFALTTYHGSAQTVYDSAARTSLADDINRTYGTLVTPSLSIAELFDIKNRLDKADSIAHDYGVDLDYREHSFIEMCDIESRIRLALEINQQFGKNLNWREYGYPQLIEIEQQLKSQAQPAKR
jgi:hypothetical protein